MIVNALGWRERWGPTRWGVGCRGDGVCVRGAPVGPELPEGAWPGCCRWWVVQVPLAWRMGFGRFVVASDADLPAEMRIISTWILTWEAR